MKLLSRVCCTWCHGLCLFRSSFCKCLRVCLQIPNWYQTQKKQDSNPSKTSFCRCFFSNLIQICQIASAYVVQKKFFFHITATGGLLCDISLAHDVMLSR
uniref:Putative secreted protein n=1 Tax=Anopheles triannulatus TaxID=58253 RepID=A0A2M4AZ12_9DIPT